ncbi:unnamed protein product [Ceutorhynchus assimilis]|uniref:F-box/LRR-repeat protein 15-like leucin rich repeat domain-containing protein n=1 Tax=Ceutorhynchus assimilis TaxID=467358 RepID=A0A9P0GQD7_9CUCU|nr:unnamed protein product [Ceutorhynchus assimilis]
MEKRLEYSVDLLTAMAMKCIIKNLSFYQNSEFKALEQLPIPLKNSILKKFTTTGLNTKNVNALLVALINKQTTEINMTPFTITDNLLEKLCVCENMKKIYWFRDRIGCEFTSAGLINFLEHTPELTFLMLVKNDEINDAVLKCISNNCGKLEVLEIAGSENVTDAGLMYLSTMNLTSLSVIEANITDQGLIALSKGKITETLKELVVSRCNNVTHLGLKTIVKHCLNLTWFNLMNNANVNAAEVEDIDQILRIPLNQVFYDLTL